MRILVAYDGTFQSKEALRYGLDKVRQQGGALFALHVFKSNMFAGYDAIPGAEDMARMESSRFVADAERLIKDEGKGVWTKMIVDDGEPEEEIVKYAKERHVDLILCPPRYKSVIKKFSGILKEEGRDIMENQIPNGAARLKMPFVSAPAR